MKAKFFSSLGVTFFILWMIWWNLDTKVPIYFFKVPGLDQYAPHVEPHFYLLVLVTVVVIGIPFGVFNIVNRNHYLEESRKAKKKADKLLEENVALQEQLGRFRPEPAGEAVELDVDLDVDDADEQQPPPDEVDDEPELIGEPRSTAPDDEYIEIDPGSDIEQAANTGPVDEKQGSATHIIEEPAGGSTMSGLMRMIRGKNKQD